MDRRMKKQRVFGEMEVMGTEESERENRGVGGVIMKGDMRGGDKRRQQKS